MTLLRVAMPPVRFSPTRTIATLHRHDRKNWAGRLGSVVLAMGLVSCFHLSPRSRPSPPAAAKPTPAVAQVGATSRGNANPTPAPTPAPSPSRRSLGVRVGSVRAIGEGGHFVLVETAALGLMTNVADGQELRCVRPSAEETGDPGTILKVSKERRPPFIVADVLAGEPHIGDDVYLTNARKVAPFAPASSPPPNFLLVPPGVLPPTTTTATPAPR